ncbi:MAG TPA: hypothetical protein VFP60_05875 [Pseudolabrys sp.]|nr:hypothetical protein [Pseudolabrys sp.]
MSNGGLRNPAFLVGVALMAIASACAGAQTAEMRAAVPLDPVEGILAAFKTHQVVALGEGAHNNEQAHVFRMSLIRDPRFAKVVDDIVVEFGNSRYQDIMDRFVGGEDVPHTQLQQVWQNTTQAHEIWDVPIYEEFFREVRKVNARLPKKRRLRVLLGDLAIDWDRIKTQEDLRKAVRTDKVPAGIIEREVISQGRRALVIYGDMHFVRRNTYWMMEDQAAAKERYARPVETIVALLERSGTKVFSIRTSTSNLAELQPDIATWTPPKLALLAGTPLGQASFLFYYPDDIYIRRPDNTWEQVKADPQRSPLMQDQFDAVLYIGPESSITYSKVSKNTCADQAYMQMRIGRMKIQAGPNADSAGAELREYCAKLLADE